jgi:hypothetical protein
VDSVAVTLSEEIIRLVGPVVYDRLLHALGQPQLATWVPHPAVRRNSTL